MPAHSKVNHEDTYESNHVNGPVQKRGCTDILCLLLFIAFIGGMFAITGYAIHKGHPELIGRGYDADGNICGYSSGYEDYPLLYWPAPVNGLLTHTVCVSACPTDPLPSALNCHLNSQFQNCESNINIQNLDSSQINFNTFVIYDTKSLAGRICLPASGVSFAQISQSFLDSDLINQWVSDVRTTWPIIAASVGIAFVIGLAYMVLIRYCAGVMTWAAILFFTAGTAILGWRFWERSKETEALINSTENTGGDSNLENTKLTEQIIAGICWGISAVTFLTVFCLYGRIRLAIAILKAAADYVKDTVSVFLVPPVFFVALLVFYTYWAITTVFLVSSGDPVQLGDMPVGTFEFNKTTTRLLIYHLFALLWCNAFILAACQFVVASSVCIWYFSQGTGQAGSGSIRKSVYRLFRYHLGSIAFGSLVLAIVQFIRVILAYIERKTKQWAGSEGKVLRFFLGCLQCYASCFERFIKFLNKNAWIQIALTGKNFCSAARAGLKLAVNNPLRVTVVYGIANIFVLFGKLFVAAASTLIGFVIITKADTYALNTYSPFIPAVIMFLFTYTVGALFLNVYGMAADTILACFLLDEEMQRKRNAPPLNCPSSLKKFLEKYRK